MRKYNMKYTMIIAILFLLLGVSELDATQKTINFGKKDQYGNKVPMYVPFVCEYKDGEIVIYASRDIFGEVTIVNVDEEIVGQGYGNFNPSLSILVNDSETAFTITVYVEAWDITYVGYIY